MISAQNTAYNNYDPRPMPVGTELMPKATLGTIDKTGIPDKFIAKIDQFNEVPLLGGAAFPNKANEIYPCFTSPALHLEDMHGQPPILDGFAFTPSTGVARNQPNGLGTDEKQVKLFRQRPFAPAMSNNAKSFGH